MDAVWLVVGLGNPGARYSATRHNLGQMVLDELARRRSESFRSHPTRAAVAQTRLAPGEDRMVLAKPATFMNVSGAPVAALAGYFRIPPERIVVVHDELDIPFDSVRLKQGGSAGGHNGVRDVAAALGTDRFLRVRVGVGRPPGHTDPTDWLLRDFTPTERQTLPNLVVDAADAVEDVIRLGLVAAQQRWHSPR